MPETWLTCRSAALGPPDAHVYIHMWDDDLGNEVPPVVIRAKQAITVGEKLTDD